VALPLSFAARSFPSKEAPRFHKGTSVNIAFQCFGLVLALCMTASYRYENRRRDKIEGGRPAFGEALNVQEECDLAPGRCSVSWRRMKNDGE
jgi:hypothetical protein